MKTTGYPYVSVIIPVLNEEKVIEKCLLSVLAQDYPAERFEVIVVDGKSEDASVAIVTALMKRYDNMVLLENPNRIIPAALNMGIKRATGDIISRFNAHSIAPNNYLSVCVKYLLETGVDHVTGGIKPVNTSFWGRSIGLATSSSFGIGDSKLYHSQKNMAVERGFCGAYRKKCLLDLGLFDEELKVGEDFDLYLRLRASGGQILLISDLKMNYFCRDSLINLFRQYFRYGFWKVRIFRKHKKVTSLRAVVPALFVLFNVLFGISSFWHKSFLDILVAVDLVYLLLIMMMTVKMALKNGYGYMCSLPPVFLTLHVSHGAGFLCGFLNFPLKSKTND